MGSEWQPIAGRPKPFMPVLNWSVDWWIAVCHKEADDVVPGGQGDFVFVDRHVRPDVTLGPSTARTLYPHAPRYVFKYNAGEACRLTLCLPRSWMAAPFRVGFGEGIRKTFYLGALDDGENPVTEVRAVIRAAPNRSWRLWPPFAGWVLRINGTTHQISEGSGNGRAPARYGDRGFSLQLPLTALKENALNTIEMENASAEDDYLVTRIYPDTVEPYEPCFLSASTPAIVEQDVVGVHTCDVTVPHVPV